jgi:hypothetical protein
MDWKALLQQKEAEINGHLTVNQSLRNQVSILQEAVLKSNITENLGLGNSDDLVVSINNKKVSINNKKRPHYDDEVPEGSRKKTATSKDQFVMVEKLSTPTSVVKLYRLCSTPYEEGVIFILSNDLANSVPKSTRLPPNLTLLDLNWPLFRRWSKLEMKETIHSKVSKCYFVNAELQNWILDHNWDLGTSIAKYI